MNRQDTKNAKKAPRSKFIATLGPGLHSCIEAVLEKPTTHASDSRYPCAGSHGDVALPPAFIEKLKDSRTARRKAVHARKSLKPSSACPL